MLPRNDTTEYMSTQISPIIIGLILLSLLVIFLAGIFAIFFKRKNFHKTLTICGVVGIIGSNLLLMWNIRHAENALTQNVKTAYNVESIELTSAYQKDHPTYAMISKDGKKINVLIYQDEKTYEPTLFLTIGEELPK